MSKTAWSVRASSVAPPSSSARSDAPTRALRCVFGAVFLGDCHKFARAARQLDPIGFLKDFGGNQRRTDTQRDTAGLEKVRGSFQIDSTGRHDPKMRQRTADGFDVV